MIRSPSSRSPRHRRSPPHRRLASTNSTNSSPPRSPRARLSPPATPRTYPIPNPVLEGLRLSHGSGPRSGDGRCDSGRFGERRRAGAAGVDGGDSGGGCGDFGRALPRSDRGEDTYPRRAARPCPGFAAHHGGELVRSTSGGHGNGPRLCREKTANECLSQHPRATPTTASCSGLATSITDRNRETSVAESAGDCDRAQSSAVTGDSSEIQRPCTPPLCRKRRRGRVLVRKHRSTCISFSPSVSDKTEERAKEVQISLPAPAASENTPPPFSSQAIRVGGLDVPIQIEEPPVAARFSAQPPLLAWVEKKLFDKGCFCSSDFHPAHLSDSADRVPKVIRNKALVEALLLDQMPEANRGRGMGRGNRNNKQGVDLGQNSNWQQPQQQQQNFGPQGGFGFGFPPQWNFQNQFPGQFQQNQWGNPQGNWGNPPMMPQGFPPQQMPLFPPPQIQQQFPPPIQQQAPLQQPVAVGGPQPGQQGNLQQSVKQGSKNKKGKPAGASIDAQSSASDKSSKAKNSYLNAVCYNCGEPGHNKSSCTTAPFCFICKSTSHKEDACPVRKQKLPTASLIGGADPGLEFFHIDCSDIKKSSENSNIGIVFIEAGEVSKEELAQEFSVIHKTNWPWPIKELDGWSYLVKFPPHLPVENVVGYPCFGLSKEGVTVNVEVWDGEVEACEEAHEVWLQLRGVKQEWYNWGPMAQFASAFGILEDMDWLGAFKSFYGEVRIKILCRNPELIPKSRVFEFEKKFHKIYIKVEPPTVADPELPDDADPKDDDQSNGRQEGSEMDTELGSDGTHKSADKTVDKGNKGSGGSSTNQRKVSTLSEEPCDENMSSLSPELPEHLEAARRNILAWLSADIPDEERCFNLLRDMEIVGEEGLFCYDQDPTESVKQNASEEEKLLDAEMQEREIVAETTQIQNTDTEVGQGGETEAGQELAAEDGHANKKSKTWGPIQGARHCERLQKHGGKPVLQMAQEVRQKKDSTIPATSKLKGFVAYSQDAQEMEIAFQARDAGKDRQLLGDGDGQTQMDARTDVGVIQDMSSLTLAKLLLPFAPDTPSASAPALQAASPPRLNLWWKPLTTEDTLNPLETQAKLREVLERHMSSRLQ